MTLLTGFPRGEPSALLAALRTAIDSYRTSYEDGSLSLRFTGVDTHTPNYFQYLFAVVHPSPQLLALRAAVRQALSPELDGKPDDYFPHLSLAYGADEGERQVGRMIEELTAAAAGDEASGEEGFAVGGERGLVAYSVQLVECDGPPGDWKVLGQVDL